MEKIVKIMVFAGIAAVVAGCAGKSGDKAAVPGAAAVVPSVEVVTAVSRDVPQESSYSASVEAYATNNIV